MDRDELNWRMYAEHVTQARQHETQRERMTALIVAIAGAGVAFASQNGLTRSDLLLTLPIIALGIFGASFSRKHYERNRMHVAIASAYLLQIDTDIYKPRNAAEKRHSEKPEFRRLYRRHLHRYWEELCWAVATLGAIASIVVVWNSL